MTTSAVQGLWHFGCAVWCAVTALAIGSGCFAATGYDLESKGHVLAWCGTVLLSMWRLRAYALGTASQAMAALVHKLGSTCVDADAWLHSHVHPVGVQLLKQCAWYCNQLTTAIPPQSLVCLAVGHGLVQWVQQWDWVWRRCVPPCALVVHITMLATCLLPFVFVPVWLYGGAYVALHGVGVVIIHTGTHATLVYVVGK